MIKKLELFLFLSMFILQCGIAKTGRYRVMWRNNPTSSIVVGWDQISGANPEIFYDVIDYGTETTKYQLRKKADRVTKAKGMNNHFARLNGLRPNTIYYFVIKDSEGTNRRLSFRTPPDSPSETISIIAGGDSRNHRQARQQANKLVAALRPHCILFSGDMTANDSPNEWAIWFDDWQLTISKDGRIHPIVVARGNHESDNKGLYELFDVSNSNLYYSLNVGGSLLEIITLNSLLPISGDQKDWLSKELANSNDMTWKFVQYHNSMRPHNSSKKERSDLIYHWATLFHKFGVDLAVESDAHCVKWTYPIRPSRAPGSDGGFIEDPNGTIYIGEGGWGAPLRENNDNKVWTRDSGSFNQFKWIFVNEEKISIRTLKIDRSGNVGPLSDENMFEVTPSIRAILWSPKNGNVVTIKNPKYSGPALLPNKKPSNTIQNKQPIKELAVLKPDPNTKKVNLAYKLKEKSKVEIILLNTEMKPVARFELENQYPGLYDYPVDLSQIRPGKYQLIIKTNDQLFKKFGVQL